MSVPVLFGSLLKDQAKAFLRDNEIPFPEDATKERLFEIAREHLVQAGLNPDYFDFNSRRPLMAVPVNNKHDDDPVSAPMIRDLPPPSHFAVEPSHSVAIRWERWVDQFQVYADAVELVRAIDAVQRSVFLHVAGPEVMELVKHLEEDPAIENAFQRALDALSAYFKPRKNRHFERHLFRDIRQEGETIDSFYTRLRAQASACEFSDGDERILEQIIEKCSNAALRKKLLERGDELTLKTALEVARSFETVNAQSSVMNATPNVSNLSTSPRTCLFCSKSHVFKRELCPARQATCSSCGATGHYASAAACKSRASGSAPGKKNKNKKKNKSKKLRKLNSGDGNSGGNADDILDAEGDYLSVLDRESRSSLHTTLLVHDKRVNFQLDTGASLNVIGAEFVPSGYEMLPPDTVKMYDGSALKTLGKVILPVVNPRTKIRYRVLFTVVESGAPILGLNTLLKMNLMTISAKQVFRLERVNAKAQWLALLSKHERLFRDELGCIKGVQVHVKVKEEATPVFFRARPIPYALRPRVEQALDRAVRDGTLVHLESSDWSSPTVNVEKRDGTIRVCGDYSVSTNRVLEVEEHPLPTPEELFSKLSGTKFFAKCDFRTCFEQFVVSEESQKYLTINTHRGLFGVTRCLTRGLLV